MAGKEGFDPLAGPEDSDAAADVETDESTVAAGSGAAEEPVSGGGIRAAIEGLGPGQTSNVLLLGPMERQRGEESCLHFFGSGSLAETNVLFVSLTRSADDRLELLRRHAEGFPANVGIVTATDQFTAATTTSGSEEGDGSGGVSVRTVSDPSDLPKLGVTISRLVNDWEDEGRETIVCFHSLSVLLQYADLQRVFRFLHILKDRLASVDATTHYHMDSMAHDQQTVATLRQLFDAVVEYDEGGEATVRR